MAEGRTPSELTDSKSLSNDDGVDAKKIGVSKPLPSDGKTRRPDHADAEAQKVKMPTTKDSTFYNFNLKKRGVALVFNHHIFDRSLKIDDRKEFDTDKRNIKNMILSLGFEESDIKECDDYKKENIKKTISNAVSEKHEDHDCLLVVVSTNIDEGGRLYAKNSRYMPSELWENFSADKCPGLAGKPKIFIIQASENQQVVDPKEKTSHDGPSYKIPSYSDFLVVYSAIPRHYSSSIEEQGSWFFHCLSRILCEDNKEQRDFLTLLLIANYLTDKRIKQLNISYPERVVPCITSMLTRKLIFKPKQKKVA